MRLPTAGLEPENETTIFIFPPLSLSFYQPTQNPRCALSTIPLRRITVAATEGLFSNEERQPLSQRPVNPGETFTSPEKAASVFTAGEMISKSRSPIFLLGNKAKERNGSEK